MSNIETKRSRVYAPKMYQNKNNVTIKFKILTDEKKAYSPAFHDSFYTLKLYTSSLKLKYILDDTKEKVFKQNVYLKQKIDFQQSTKQKNKPS